MNLELMAMVWLRCEKRCDIVLRERSPRSWQCGQPDVIGVTPSRFMIEVEVKRSVSDFRADFKKPSRRNRDLYPHKLPKYFYYFAPEKVAFHMFHELPNWAGLLYVPEDAYQPYVKVKAPANPLSEKVSDDEFVELAHLLTNHLLSSESSRECERNYFRVGHDPYIYPNVSHFEI